MDKQVLDELISQIRKRTSIKEEILEKDYYVCLILKDLASKQNKLQAYFKGGTAIYKILDQMNRFSEDIDLTVTVNENESNNSNRTRLKKSALDYHIKGLELDKSKTIDRKGSITAFYKYDTLYKSPEIFKPETVQIESTSFTVSEPYSTYIIEPLIYKYATKEEKKVLKEKYNISDFPIKIITLERIFVDKIFAAQFYYERKMYKDVAKHLYDITILTKNNDIKNLLNDKNKLNKLIEYKRKEEKSRIGGIPEEKKIKNFDYFKLDFNHDMIDDFNKMQNLYVLGEENKITIDEVKETLKNLYNKFWKIKKLIRMWLNDNYNMWTNWSR